MEPAGQAGRDSSQGATDGAAQGIAQPKKRPAWEVPLLLMIGVAVFSWAVAEQGIDFGFHIDETARLGLVQASCRSLEFLPDSYLYPSLPFELACVPALPEIVKTVWLVGTPVYAWVDPAAPREARARVQAAAGELWQTVDSGEYLFRVRHLFLAITLTTGIWTFLLVWVWRKSPWEGFFAGSLVFLSWEVGYHARWIAPDGVVMAFSALTLLLLFVSKSSPRPLCWTVLAAVAAGLATSSKYTGGILLLSVLFLVVYKARVSSWGLTLGRAVSHGLLVIVVFVGVFLVTNPGALAQPARFIADVRSQMNIFGWIGVGEVGPGQCNNCYGFVDHASLVLGWLGTALLSPYAWVALPLALMVLVGAAVLLRRSWIDAALLVVMPAVFLVYFAMQKVLYIRTYLWVAPLMAILATVGVSQCWTWLARRNRWASRLLLVGCALALGLNAYWGWHASETIRWQHQRDEMADLEALIDRHPERFFVLSRNVLDKRASLATRANVGDPRETHVPAGRIWVAFYSSEVKNGAAWPCNRLHYTLLPSAPLEVNWDYYPFGTGCARVVLLPMETIMNTLLWDDLKHGEAFP